MIRDSVFSPLLCKNDNCIDCTDSNAETMATVLDIDFGIDSNIQLELFSIDEYSKYVCGHCQEELEDIGDTYTYNNDKICETCFESNFGYCEISDEIHLISDLVEVNYRDNYYELGTVFVSQKVCDRYFFECRDCEGYFHKSQEEYYELIGRGNICGQCYEDGYNTCEICENIVSSEQGYYANDDYCFYCESCYQQVTVPKCIKEYATNPLDHLDFLPSYNPNTIYFGIELEVEVPEDDSRYEVAEEINDLVEEFAILKKDDSLSYGFEIVTAPSTLDEHKKNWQVVEDFPCLQWMPKSCGMHVHISRSPLSDLTVGKILYFVNSNLNNDFIVTVAERNNIRHATINQKKITDVNKMGGYDRFQAVNLKKYGTIEIRIFQGEANLSKILKNVEFCHALVNYCQTSSMQKLDYINFLKWLRNESNKTYENLKSFLKSQDYAEHLNQ